VSDLVLSHMIKWFAANWVLNLDKMKVQHVMQLGWWSVSVTLTLSNHFCYAYFDSVVKYRIIFGGNFSNSGKIFSLEKKIVRIMAGAQPRASCRSLFKQSEILPFPWHALMSFIINNQETFQTSLFIHSINTWNKHHLHRPNANLSCFQKVCSMLA
jgi:hypothetical protein